MKSEYTCSAEVLQMKAGGGVPEAVLVGLSARAGGCGAQP